MDKERSSGIRRRLGPIGLSLIAAAVTAVGFAAVSLAQNDNGKEGSGQQTFEAPAPPGGGEGAVFFHRDLSDADRQKMEEFRQCMEDNGAPGPPRIQEGDGPPKPPSSEERDKIQQAYEACKDKLPEDLQNAPFPPHPPCGPPPGAPSGSQDAPPRSEGR